MSPSLLFQREGLFLSTAELCVIKQCHFIEQWSAVQGTMNGIYCVVQLHELNSAARPFTQSEKQNLTTYSQISGRTISGARIDWNIHSNLQHLWLADRYFGILWRQMLVLAQYFKKQLFTFKHQWKLAVCMNVTYLKFSQEGRETRTYVCSNVQWRQISSFKAVNHNMCTPSPPCVLQ